MNHRCVTMSGVITDVPVPISKEENFSQVNDAAQIFLLENIGIKEMAEIAPELLSLASLLSPQKNDKEEDVASDVVTNNIHRISSPYDITCANMPLLDFYINGYGMSYNAYNQIASAISLAKSRGVIIRTTVTGLAAGIAGLIAAMGTPGFRIMYAGAQHYMTIPQPIASNVYNNKSSVGFKNGATAQNNLEELPQWAVDAYKGNTQLTQKQIKSVLKNHNGFMDSRFCQNHGVCDWILKNDGTIAVANALTQSKQR